MTFAPGYAWFVGLRASRASLCGALVVVGSLLAALPAAAQEERGPWCGTGRYLERWADEPASPFSSELSDDSEHLLGRPLSVTRHLFERMGQLHVRIDDRVLRGPEGHYSDGELGPSGTWVWASQTPTRIEVFRLRGDALEPIGELASSFAPGVRVEWVGRTVLHYIDPDGGWAAVDLRRLRPLRAPVVPAAREGGLVLSEDEDWFHVRGADGATVSSAPRQTPEGPLVDARLTRTGDGLCAHLLVGGMLPSEVRCTTL